MSASSSSLTKKTSRVSLMTFISRTLGFMRDLLAAQVYGVNAAVDAFNIAFRVPNLLRNLFSEGAFSQALVPVLARQHYVKSPQEAALFVDRFFGQLIFILLILTTLGMIFSPWLIHLLSPGLDLTRHHLASDMLWIMMPYLFFVGITAFGASVLNTRGFFILAAFLPALLNIVLIFSALCVSHWFLIPVYAQAYGVCAAGIIQLLFLLFGLVLKGNLPRPKLSFKDKEILKSFRRLLPTIFGSSVGQLNLFVNTVFASFLPVGSISFLYYSERLAYFPQGVFAVALATVIMPHLVKQFSLHQKKGFSDALQWGLRANFLVGMPATLVLIIFSGPIVLTLFQHGRFTLHDAMMTGRSIMTYAVGLQAFMLVKLLSTANYARGDFKTPIRVGVLVLFINIGLNGLFLKPLGFAGLALGTSIAAWINAVLLGIALWKSLSTMLDNVEKHEDSRQIPFFYLRLLAVNFILMVLLHLIHGPASIWYAWSGLQRFLHLFLDLSGVILAYFILLRLFGISWKMLSRFE